MSNDKICRITLRMPEETKKFYEEESKKYNLGYTSYITYLLVEKAEKIKDERDAIDSLKVLKELKIDSDEDIAESLMSISEAIGKK